MASNEEENVKTGEENQVCCTNDPEVTLSKSQLKKLRKKEKWEQNKAQKRKAEKERYKARKRARRERGEELGPSRKKLRHNTMSKSKCKLRVVIDCDFDEYMAEKDINMLVKQIQFSYSANRRSENPLQFYCCGISGKTNSRLESLGDHRGWDINFHSTSYSDMFEKSSVVYLSSESPNILHSLEEDKVYIIGGLVDHNHHKGLCHRLAEERGIAHAQLPISDHIDMKTRKVLTINHVFEILLHYTETSDWQKAIYTVLPPRKGAVPKPVGGVDNDDSDNAKSDNADKDSDADDAECKEKNDVKKTDEPHSNSGTCEPNSNSGTCEPNSNSGTCEPNSNSGTCEPNSNSGICETHSEKSPVPVELGAGDCRETEESENTEPHEPVTVTCSTKDSHTEVQETNDETDEDSKKQEL